MKVLLISSKRRSYVEASQFKYEYLDSKSALKWDDSISLNYSPKYLIPLKTKIIFFLKLNFRTNPCALSTKLWKQIRTVLMAPKIEDIVCVVWGTFLCLVYVFHQDWPVLPLFSSIENTQKVVLIYLITICVPIILYNLYNM